ncbi:MAG: segregation/condensation protein A [Candidatus Latescibacter sp.]|nr:segregation/condensation protein A [Candidatus Latescibacter sp.]
MTKVSIPLKKEVLSHSDTAVTPGPPKEEHIPKPDTTYHVITPVFEGPIDLLLYLIKKNELDIHEVSLAAIANEYLEYVELIKLVDLERAGEFIVVASTLMKIKSRSLFLANADDGEETEEDTKAALIKYLLEYQKLGGAAEKLAEKEAERRGVYPRAGEKTKILDQFTPRDNAPDYVLFDLLSALREVLSTVPKSVPHEVELLNVTSEMKQQEILEIIARDGSTDFIKLVKGKPRIIIVVTFIAMLELIKSGKIGIRQANQFGRIIIYDKSADQNTNT